MWSISNLFADKQWLIIVLIFFIAMLMQLVFYLGFYLRFVLYRKKPQKSNPEPVSVIICARNEADNLDNYLPVILTQDYPEYEVIVVNDCSTDDTGTVLDKYTKQYSRLRVSPSESRIHGNDICRSKG